MRAPCRSTIAIISERCPPFAMGVKFYSIVGWINENNTQFIAYESVESCLNKDNKFNKFEVFQLAVDRKSTKY